MCARTVQLALTAQDVRSITPAAVLPSRRGIDIAPSAIGRARRLAAEHGIPDGRITWRVADLAIWQPDGRYTPFGSAAASELASANRTFTALSCMVLRRRFGGDLQHG